MSPSIEELYQSRMQSLTPVERIERCAAMFQWTREMLARQIIKEMGPLPSERLKWEVALRQYGADPKARALIERMLANVSH
jgi:hypothetical protein